MNHVDVNIQAQSIPTYIVFFTGRAPPSTGHGLRIWCEESLQDLWLGTVACPSHMVRKLHHDHHCTLEKLMPMFGVIGDAKKWCFNWTIVMLWPITLGSWTCSLPSGLVCFLYVSRCCFLAATNFILWPLLVQCLKDFWGSESGHHHHGDSSSLHCFRVTLAKLRLIWTHAHREWILRTTQTYRWHWHIRSVSGFGRWMVGGVLLFLDIFAFKICKHPLTLGC